MNIHVPLSMNCEFILNLLWSSWSHDWFPLLFRVSNLKVTLQSVLQSFPFTKVFSPSCPSKNADFYLTQLVTQFLLTENRGSESTGIIDTEINPLVFPQLYTTFPLLLSVHCKSVAELLWLISFHRWSGANIWFKEEHSVTVVKRGNSVSFI